MEPIEQTENLTKINQCASKLIAHGLSVAFAESATAGRICADLSLAEHAGKFLKGGLVCYNAELKQQLLAVNPELIRLYTPESPEVTEAITRGLARLLPADIHIGCTGLTCPGGSETEEKPVGTMFFHGTRAGETIFSQRAFFNGTPQQIVEQSVIKTIDLLLAYMETIAESQSGTDQWAVSWP